MEDLWHYTSTKLPKNLHISVCALTEQGGKLSVSGRKSDRSWKKQDVQSDTHRTETVRMCFARFFLNKQYISLGIGHHRTTIITYIKALRQPSNRQSLTRVRSRIMSDWLPNGVAELQAGEAVSVTKAAKIARLLYSAFSTSSEIWTRRSNRRTDYLSQ